MAEECTDCNQSIFNNQESIIPDPLCSSTCPEHGVCIDTISSKCVYVPFALDCIGTDAGASLNLVLTALEAFVCASSGGGDACKVKADATDTCCEYLEDKIYSDTLDVTTDTVRSCHRVVIEEKDYTFANFTPQNKWVNRSTVAGGYVNCSYGVRNNDITLRGQLYYASNGGGTTVTLTLGTLPTIARPTERKVFSYTAPNVNGLMMNNVVITIETTGVITTFISNILGGTFEYCTLSLDHCKWIK